MALESAARSSIYLVDETNKYAPIFLEGMRDETDSSEGKVDCASSAPVWLHGAARAGAGRWSRVSLAGDPQGAGDVDAMTALGRRFRNRCELW